MIASFIINKLDAVIALVGYDDVVIAVDCNSLWTVELALVLARFVDTKSANMRAIPTTKHLHAVVVVIANYDVAAIDCNADWVLELARQFAATTEERHGRHNCFVKPWVDCGD